MLFQLFCCNFIIICAIKFGSSNSEPVLEEIIQAINDANFEQEHEESEKSEARIDMVKIIEQVNSAQSTWKPGENFAPDIPASYFKNLVGSFLDEDEDDENFGNEIEEGTKCDCDDNDNLPKNFDSRKRWPKCPSIGHIYDQGNCGSCWAIAPASALSDRLCIASGGKFNKTLSGQALTSCCYRCRPGNRRDGCQGGWPSKAWKFFHRHGLVTGADYNSNDGCQPYLIAPCEHHTKGPLPNCTKEGMAKDPGCKLHCYNKHYTLPWKKDLHKSKYAFKICPCGGMKEIYSRGPITATFAVYEDFLTYKSGVYKYTTGKLVGYHAVRVIGWGIENNVPYWLVTNSWNSHWGDKGTFKIIRGDNEVWIENNLVAAKAKA